MKYFILSFVIFFLTPALYAQESIFFLDPDNHILIASNGQISSVNPDVSGISQDLSGNVIVLSKGGLFKKFVRPDGTEDSTAIIEEPSARRSPIIQYQIDTLGRLALLRADGTIEINFVPTKMGFDPKANAQMAFSEKGLWVLQKDASLYKWNPQEHIWKFVAQDESVRAIVATPNSLYALKVLENGLFALCEFKEALETEEKIEIIRTNISFGKNLNFLSLPTQHTEPLAFGYHQGFLVLLIRDTATNTYQAVSLPEELVQRTLLEGMVINRRDVKITSLDLSSCPKDLDLKLMTSSGMNCKTMKWFPDPKPADAPPSLSQALSHIKGTVKANPDPEGLKSPSFLDGVSGRILDELTIWDEFTAKGPPGTAENMRLVKEALNKDTLRVVETLLQDPRMRRITLERVIDLIIEAQKRNPHLR
ncbi:MAG: hypothetical protein A3G92_05545 [Deltaproteobacteria bacterium RIFCSPLOWO2_12_FULL_38_8]|nr:MAG: hypothetical protein A3G92_05545 [Deltaproteobacteria bacterium RIFCSPLOWO2_12_FULL_38_8]